MAALGALAVGSASGPFSGPMILRAADFGAVGDGRTDDGPAIRRMLDALPRGRKVSLRFAAARTYSVRSARGRYVFPFEGDADVTLDGGGSIFELAPDLRFMRMSACRRMTVRRLRVDFRPLPFIDGVVTRVDAADRALSVRAPGADADRALGGPTRQDGEQAYYGMLWFDGPYSVASRHCWVGRIERGAVAGEVTVRPTPDFTEYADIVPERWRISLPVPGIAHRYGPGACFRIRDNDGVAFEDVELWSAPWMGFEVARNRGRVSFKSVHIRPKPGSVRLMSTWRDGFHVKGNRASLLWEDCILSGMNDDAFNISTHSSLISRALPDGRIEVRQKFPLLYVPWEVGDRLSAADEHARRLVGSSRIVGVEEGKPGAPIQGEPVAPAVTLRLDRALPDLAVGTMVWNADAANPKTVLRRCRIEMSCRLQSPVTLDGCTVNALLWFYAEPVEGPFPGPVTVRRCTLRRGRGNPVHAVVCSGGPEGSDTRSAQPPRALHDFAFVGNRIEGGFVVDGVERVRIEGNRFAEVGAPIRTEGALDMTFRMNRGPSGEPIHRRPPTGETQASR